MARKCLLLLACAAAPLAFAQDNPTARRGVANFTMLNGFWYGANLENRSGCATAGVNGIHGTYAQYFINWVPTTAYLTIQENTVTNLSCSWSGNASDNEWLRPTWSGTFSCSDGKAGTFQSTSFLITPNEMQIRLRLKWTNSEGCDADAILGGSRF